MVGGSNTHMTEIIIICLAALVTSLLTFFSGFGLGTILTPVFMIFFPVSPCAIWYHGAMYRMWRFARMSAAAMTA